MPTSPTITRVLPLTVEQARALAVSSAELEALTAFRVVPGFLEFPEAVAPILEQLEQGVPPEWFSHLVVDGRQGVVVGLGGYTGPPEDDTVEVGYSIAPEARGRGHATNATRAWVEAARARGVRTVVAHTLAERNPSTGVLERCGFTRTADVVSPEGEPLWRWERRL